MTIFHALREDPDLPPEEKTRERLVAEAGSIVGAGTLTSAHMLSLTTYIVFNDASILTRLLAGLDKAIPDPSSSASLQTLEPLPYLNAVINEGFRTQLREHAPFNPSPAEESAAVPRLGHSARHARRHDAAVPA